MDRRPFWCQDQTAVLPGLEGREPWPRAEPRRHTHRGPLHRSALSSSCPGPAEGRGSGRDPVGLQSQTRGKCGAASCKGSSGLSPLSLLARSGQRVGSLGGLGWSRLVQVAESTLLSAQCSLPGARAESTVQPQVFSAFFTFKSNCVCFIPH